MRTMWKIALLFFIFIFGLLFINYIANKTIGMDVNKAEKSNFSVSKTEAKKIAEWRFNKSIQEDDPVFKSWEQSILGDPVLVKTVKEEPFYWTVPIIFREKVIGFIDIDGNKSIPRYGIFGCGTPDNLSACPYVITFITSEEAVELAKNVTARYPDANISAPIFVYDDEKSHAAWMLKVETKGAVISRIFVAGNYVYERKEGEIIKNVAGINIAFEENISKNDAITILDGYNLISPYELNYDFTGTRPLFYIIIPKENFETLKNHLEVKGVYLQITSKKINDQAIVMLDSILSENEITPIMDSYNLSLKRFSWVYINYKGSDISKEDGTALKENLEKNNRIIFVSLDYRKG